MGIQGEVAMDLRDLSLKDLALVEALAEIARAECAEHGWDEIEPMLASCWKDNHRFVSAMSWDAVAPYVRAVCDARR